MIVCRFDIQWIGPFDHIIKPDIDRLLKSSRGGSFGFDFDWSWGPQLASVKGVMDLGLIENLANASNLKLRLLVNSIPRCLVPLRQQPPYLNVSRCPFVALWIYLESIFVMVAISGHVLVANHWKHPVSCCSL